MTQKALQPAPPPKKIDANGDYHFDCPLCDPPDTGGHLRVEPSAGKYHCYKCKSGGSTLWLRWKTGVEWPCTVDDPAAIAERSPALDLVKKRKPVDPIRVHDYEKDAAMPYLITQDAASAAGLGSVAMLPKLSSLPINWWMGETPILSLFSPWYPVIEAARYMVGRGLYSTEAEEWGLRVVADPEAGCRYGGVVFPGWHPLTGRFRGCQARLVPNTIRMRGLPKYMSPRIRPKNFPLLYSPRALATARASFHQMLVLVEGPMDAVAVDRAGYGCAALMGKGVRRAIVDELQGLRVTSLVLLVDSDVPAPEAHSAASQFLREGVAVYFASVGKKDPGESTVEEIRSAIRDARPIQERALKLFAFSCCQT